MKYILTFLTTITAVLAAARTSPPDGCIMVGQDGIYSEIQSAVDSLSTSSSDAQCLYILPGEYPEQVLIPPRKAKLTIYGYTEDTSDYTANQVTITGFLSQADGLSNDQTATLRVKANNFKMYNVNVANTYGQGSQAVALSAYADSGYYGCAFTGFQDTLLAQTGNQLYSKCMITGATDFVFGQNAPAWFEKCDIRVVTAKIGYITANGRSSLSGRSYYVFNKCDVAAASDSSVEDGAIYLGRPWGEFARVVFQRTNMSEIINAAGWHIWNTGDERTDNVLFGEYKNKGIGAAGPRASFATTLDSAVSIKEVLGNGYSNADYYDSSYM